MRKLTPRKSAIHRSNFKPCYHLVWVLEKDQELLFKPEQYHWNVQVPDSRENFLRSYLVWCHGQLQMEYKDFTAAVIVPDGELDPPEFVSPRKLQIDESFFIQPSLDDLDFLQEYRYSPKGLLFSCRAPHMRIREAQFWAIEVLIERAWNPVGIPFRFLEWVFFALVRLPSIVEQEYPQLAYEFGEVFLHFMEWMQEHYNADIFDGREIPEDDCTADT